MSRERSILVVGAGELGSAILHGLSGHPFKASNSISVLIREATLSSADPTKKAHVENLKSLGVSTVLGDIVSDSEAELEELFKQFHTIVGAMGMSNALGTQLKIARAVLTAGVPRYLPWQFGLDYDAIGRGSAQDLFTEQLDVRALLRQQRKTEWVIVSTGIFMSFLFEDLFGVVDAKRTTARALGAWDNRVTVTDVDDIGRVVAEVVFAAPELKYEVVFVAGDTISYRRLADVVEESLKRKVERVEWTVANLKQELAADPTNIMKKYRVVFAEGVGVAWDMSTAFNAKRSIDMLDVKGFVLRG